MLPAIDAAAAMMPPLRCFSFFIIAAAFMPFYAAGAAFAIYAAFRHYAFASCRRYDITFADDSCCHASIRCRYYAFSPCYFAMLMLLLLLLLLPRYADAMDGYAAYAMLSLP